MKHEKFKLFPTLADPEFVAPDVVDFLSSGKTLKSISVTPTYGEFALLAIGYTDTPTEEAYMIIPVNFGGLLGYRTDELEAVIEDAASKTKGVICKSILFKDGEIIVYFLVHESDVKAIGIENLSPLENE